MKKNNNFIILTRDELRKVCGGREVLPDNLKYLEEQRGRKPSDFDIYSISDGKVIDVQYVQYDKGQEKRGYGTYIWLMVNAVLANEQGDTSLSLRGSIATEAIYTMRLLRLSTRSRLAMTT